MADIPVINHSSNRTYCSISAQIFSAAVFAHLTFSALLDQFVLKVPTSVVILRRKCLQVSAFNAVVKLSVGTQVILRAVSQLDRMNLLTKYHDQGVVVLISHASSRFSVPQACSFPFHNPVYTCEISSAIYFNSKRTRLSSPPLLFHGCVHLRQSVR
jgi:hypothetical protein